MKKLLSVMVGVGLVCMLTVSIGCDKKTTPTKTTPTTKVTPTTPTPTPTTPTPTPTPTTPTPTTPTPTTPTPTTTPPKKDTALKVSDPKGIKVKQGDKGDTKVTVTLGADLAKAAVKAWIKDKDKKDVKDLTAAVDPKTMDKTGDATVTVTAGDGVAPGDYTLTIEVTAEGGTPASVSKDATVKVEKK